MMEPTATKEIEARLLQALQELWPHYGCVLCDAPVTPSVGWKPTLIMGERDKRVNTVIINIVCGDCVQNGEYARAVERASEAAKHFQPGGNMVDLVNNALKPSN